MLPSICHLKNCCGLQVFHLGLRFFIYSPSLTISNFSHIFPSKCQCYFVNLPWRSLHHRPMFLQIQEYFKVYSNLELFPNSNSSQCNHFPFLNDGNILFNLLNIVVLCMPKAPYKAAYHTNGKMYCPLSKIWPCCLFRV